MKGGTWLFCTSMLSLACTNKIERSGMKKGIKKENGKTKRFTIRLSEEEHQEFIKKATSKNMKISEYLIYLVKKDK